MRVLQDSRTVFSGFCADSLFRVYGGWVQGRLLRGLLFATGATTGAAAIPKA